MTGLQSRSRLQHEISCTTNHQDGLPPVETTVCRRAGQASRGLRDDERDDLVNDAD
jgi:hypothetical protein